MTEEDYKGILLMINTLITHVEDLEERIKKLEKGR